MSMLCTDLCKRTSTKLLTHSSFLLDVQKIESKKNCGLRHRELSRQIKNCWQNQSKERMYSLLIMNWQIFSHLESQNYLNWKRPIRSLGSTTT